MSHNIDEFYTWSEKNVKKYTVYQAIQSAERRLDANKRFCGNLRATSIAGVPLNEKITLKRLNEIQDRIYRDSLQAERE